MDLFTYTERYPTAPGFKEGETSRAAAESMAASAPVLRDLCLQALREIGPATPDEIAAHLRLPVLSVRPRFTELLKEDRIVDTGERRTNASGRKAKVWRAA